jgi:hypothetical protein
VSSLARCGLRDLGGARMVDVSMVALPAALVALSCFCARCAELFVAAAAAVAAVALLGCSFTFCHSPKLSLDVSNIARDPREKDTRHL